MEFQTSGISKIWPEDKQHIICLCQKYGADRVMEIVKEYKKEYKKSLPSLQDIFLELNEQYEKSCVDKVESTLSTDELISVVSDWIKYVGKSLVEGDFNSKSV